MATKMIRTPGEITYVSDQVLIYTIEIIGEAAARVSDETRKVMPQIPWPSIVGMRNRLIHAYFDVDLDILRQTVSEDLPALLEQLEAF